MREGFAGRLAASFIDSKLTPLLIISALLVGIFAAYLTPREEEPQIILPVVDIYVGFPGGSPDEIAERVTRPLEQAISTIPGVEFVYSASRQDMSLITVRFYVGDDTEESLVKLWSTLLKNADKMPPGVQFPPLMRSKSIDDVPVLTLTLWSDQYDGYQLRRVGQELATELKKVENVADLTVTGGQKRQIKITLDPARMQAFRVDPLRIAGQIQAANSSLSVGEFPRLNQQFQVETGDFLQNIDDVRSLVVGVFDQRPVYLHMVADVEDGPEEVKDYVFMGFGPAGVDQDPAAAQNPDVNAASYAARRDSKKPESPGPYQRAKAALIKAKVLSSVPACAAERDAAVTAFLLEWEKSTFATAIFYLNDLLQVKLGGASPDMPAAMHAYGEIIGFVAGWKTLPADKRKVTDAQVDALLTKLLSPPDLPSTGYKLVTDTAGQLAALQGAITDIAGIYGFSAAEVESFKKNN